MIQRNLRPCELVMGAILVCILISPAWSDEIQPKPAGELLEYVRRPDASFALEEISSGRAGNTEYVQYILTSQTWQGIPWKHQLYVLRPQSMARDARTALLFVHGGRWKPEYDEKRSDLALPREAPYFVRLAESIRAPVAILRQVPFQPMFERREDALIAYTFEQYLKTGQSDWPLLLPMVKSAVRAMDATQRIAADRWGATIDSFTIAGASKRGWTSWLTAAIDHRAMAVAPMVIDVLNMRAQMDHQRATWGELSEEIRDYEALDLPTQLGTPRGEALLAMVDPFSYRAQLTEPKLILLSTNDRYWPLDALKLYWSQLPDPKHVLYVPNQGHGLKDVDRVVGGLSALHRYAANGKTLPSSRWSFNSGRQSLSIEISTDRPAQRVLIWSAHSPTLDFREARWRSRACARKGGKYVCSTALSKQGYAAAFAETAFKDEGAPLFSTTTTVCIVGGGANVTTQC